VLRKASLDFIKRYKVQIAIIVIIIIGRVILVSPLYEKPELAMDGDSPGYLSFARAISGEGELGPGGDGSDLVRTPGYPLFLAAIMLLPGELIGNIAMAQTMVSFFTGLLIFLLLRDMKSTKIGLVGLIIYLVDPVSIMWSGMVYTETLFTFFLILLVYLIYLWWKRQSRYLLIITGIFLAIASYVRPIGAVLIIPTFLFLIYAELQSKEKKRLRNIGINLALVFFTYSILTTPWTLRNKQVWGCDTFSPIGAFNIRDFMAARVVSELENITLEEAQVLLREGDNLLCPENLEKSLNIILEHPVTYARVHFTGLIPTLVATDINRYLDLWDNSFVMPDLWQHYLEGGFPGVLRIIFQQLKSEFVTVSLFIIVLLFQIVILISAGWGWGAGIRKSSNFQQAWFIFLGLVVIIMLITPGPLSYERFRVPVQPIFIYLSILGFVDIKSRISRYQKARL